MDQIKRDANRNQQNRQNSSPQRNNQSQNQNFNYNPNTSYNNTSSSGSGVNTSDCGSSANGCANCFQYGWPLIEGLFKQIEKEQIRQLSRKDSIRNITSFEVMMDANLGHNSDVEQFIFRPRMRINYGIITSDLRIFNLNEENPSGGFFSYNYLDWQVLMFNLVNNSKATFRVGAGLSYEYFTKTNYGECSIYWCVKPAKIVNFRAEWRLVPDHITSINVRREINLGVDLIPINRRNFDMLLGLNANHVKFYENVNFWTFGPMITLRLQ